MVRVEASECDWCLCKMILTSLPRATGLLTKREEGVVHLVAEGLTNRDISQQLNLSEHTVRNYLFRIFNKVGTTNRLELAYFDGGRGDDAPTAGLHSPSFFTNTRA